MTDAAGAPLRVLVVDDSALVRQTIFTILSQEGFEVITAADPLIAMERMKLLSPDVIVLDLEMPRMDGLSFLRKIMADDPRPVVVCSAVAQQGSGNALTALDEGALDIVVKPRIGVQQFLQESAVLLADAVRAASLANVTCRRLPSAGSAPASTKKRRAGAAELSPSVIAVGASTGGTTALKVLLEGLQPDSPAVVMVQHMPRPFTAMFAHTLDRTAVVEVREAVDGEPLVRGVALLAPGDEHMRVIPGAGGSFAVQLFSGPLVRRHRPSVDVLFSSVAKSCGANAVGVIMTGMGADGAEGMLEMHRAGAFTVAQDESTSVVFGMPREAIARGAVDCVLPLQDIAAKVRGVFTSRLHLPLR